MNMKRLSGLFLMVFALFFISCSKDYYVEKYGASSDEAGLYEFLEGEWEVESMFEWGYVDYRDPATGEVERWYETYEENGPVPKTSDSYTVLRFEHGTCTVLATGDPEIAWIIGIPHPFRIYDDNKVDCPLFFGDAVTFSTIKRQGKNRMQIKLDDVGYYIDCDEHDGFFVKHESYCKDHNCYINYHQRTTWRRVRKATVVTPPDGWMTYVDDSALLTQLSIPGARASATCYGLYDDLSKVTQRMPVERLWESGIRAFDLSVDASGGLKFNGQALERSFEDMTDILKDCLMKNKQETAIVFVHPSEDVTEASMQRWKDNVGEVITDLGDVAALWRPNMTMRDSRGRVVFIFNEAFQWDGRVDLAPGAFIFEYEDEILIMSMSGGTAENVYVQADQQMSDADKLEAVLENMALSMTFDNPSVTKNCWMVNSLSVGDSDFLTSALDIVPMVYDYLNGEEVTQTFSGTSLGKSWKKTEEGPLGIVFMDFASYDDSGESEVSGAMMTETIIENNFRYTMKKR